MMPVMPAVLVRDLEIGYFERAAVVQWSRTRVIMENACLSFDFNIDLLLRDQHILSLQSLQRE